MTRFVLTFLLLFSFAGRAHEETPIDYKSLSENESFTDSRYVNLVALEYPGLIKLGKALRNLQTTCPYTSKMQAAYAIRSRIRAIQVAVEQSLQKQLPEKLFFSVFGAQNSDHQKWNQKTWKDSKEWLSYLKEQSPEQRKILLEHAYILNLARFSTTEGKANWKYGSFNKPNDPRDNGC